MGATHEWIDARTERPAWVTTEELCDMMLDDDEVGPYALLMHSGCGDGALICGDGPQLAMYLSRAAVLLFRRTGTSLRPPAFRAGAEELVNGAANDVLTWLRLAGIDVDEGSAIASVIDLLVNVAVCPAKSHDPVSVESAIGQSWPNEDIETVLGWCAS
jgi:hypothetical protein